MKKIMVRYQVKTGRTAENEEMVRAVYKELKESSPEGFRYITFKSQDELTFIHLAIHEGEGKNPLPELKAFKEFQRGLEERCELKPVVSHLSTIDKYGFDF